MSVLEGDVQVGAFFMTATQQLRKVTEIETDDQNRMRIHYLCKSAKKSGYAFGFGSTKDNPPLLETFIAACESKLSDSEVEQLHQTDVLLSNE